MSSALRGALASIDVGLLQPVEQRRLRQVKVLSQAELAREMGVPTNRISQLISGKRALTAETALRLEAVLGIDAGTWMNLQAACEIWEAKKVKPARGLHRLKALKTA